MREPKRNKVKGLSTKVPVHISKVILQTAKIAITSETTNMQLI